MKNVFQSLLVFIALLFQYGANAQTKYIPLENSLLWEISGNGLSKPSYLYGTIHMICSTDYFLSEKVKKAFDASEQLLLEINLADPKELTEMQKLAMGSEPLSKKLTAEQLSKLDIILKKTTGMSVQQVDSFSLIAIMSLISMKTFGCDDLKFYEMDFIEKAKARNLEVVGLETVKSQFNTLSAAYSDAEIISALEESDTEETKEMVAEYKQERLSALFEKATEERVMNAKAKKYMLDERNQNWIRILPAMIKSKTSFIAVGSAHLAGEQGVINLLRKSGYTVKPVMN
ncbi:TraB/GumN family protein [Flavobacterium sp. IR1]|nr:TraB/GumN family protein [Flavobacterium sp. IR1]